MKMTTAGADIERFPLKTEAALMSPGAEMVGGRTEVQQMSLEHWTLLSLSSFMGPFSSFISASTRTTWRLQGERSEKLIRSRDDVLRTERACWRGGGRRRRCRRSCGLWALKKETLDGGQRGT